MSDESSKPGRKPTHRAYTAKTISHQGDQPRSLWTPIGAAWPLKSGNGFKLKLDATPINGEIILLDRTQEPSDDTQH